MYEQQQKIIKEIIKHPWFFQIPGMGPPELLNINEPTLTPALHYMACKALGCSMIQVNSRTNQVVLYFSDSRQETYKQIESFVLKAFNNNLHLAGIISCFYPRMNADELVCANPMYSKIQKTEELYIWD